MKPVIKDLIVDIAPQATMSIGALSLLLVGKLFFRRDIAIKEFEKAKGEIAKKLIEDWLQAGLITPLEYFKAKNFEEIALKAEKINPDKINRNFDKYDIDWFVRFYEDAGNISNEEMQMIWAKILAGELKRASSYSLRTLDTLRNFGKKEVELFNKIYSSSIVAKDNIFFPNYDDYMKYCGVQYSDIMFMDELGILDSNGLIVIQLSRDNSDKTLFNNNNIVIASKSTRESEEFNCKQFPYTQVGRELASLQDCSISNNDFIAFANVLKKEEKYNIGVYKITGKVEEKMQYDSYDLLENYDQAGQSRLVAASFCPPHTRS